PHFDGIYDWHHRSGSIHDVRGRLVRGNGYPVGVVYAVLLHLLFQCFPIFHRRDVDTSEQFGHLNGGGEVIAIHVFIEVRPVGICRFLETFEGLLPLAGYFHGCLKGIIIDHHEQHVGEVQCFFTFIHDEILSEKTVQVHRTQAHAVQFAVGLLNGGHHGNIGYIGDHSEGPHSGLHGLFDPFVFHHGSNVERAEVARDAIPDGIFLSVDVNVRNLRDLHDFRTKVGELHFANTVQRVLLIGIFFKENVRITTLFLCLGNLDQQVAGIDFTFLYFGIGNELIIHFVHIQIVQRLAVFLHHRMWVDQVARLILSGQLHELIGNDYANRERFDTDFFVHVDFLAIKELFDVRVEDVEVHRAGSGPLTKLVGIGEGVFQDFHDGQYAASPAFHAFDGFATGANFRNIERHTSADGREPHS